MKLAGPDVSLRLALALALTSYAAGRLAITFKVRGFRRLRSEGSRRQESLLVTLGEAVATLALVVVGLGVAHEVSADVSLVAFYTAFILTAVIAFHRWRMGGQN